MYLSEHICQEVCPFNHRSVASTEPAFQPRPATRLRLSELACISEEEFRVAFKGSPVKRAKWRGCGVTWERVVPRFIRVLRRICP